MISMNYADIIDYLSSPIVLFSVFIILIFLLYWVFTFTIFYHLIRFSVGTLPKKIAFIFLFGAVVLFCINFLFIASMDFNILIDKIKSLFSNLN